MSPPWSWMYTTSPSNAPPLWAGPGRSRASTANPTDGAPAEPVRCSSFRMTTWSTARKTTRPAGAFDVSSELSGFAGRTPGGMVRKGTSRRHLGETRGTSQGHLAGRLERGQDMKSRAAATWNGGLGDGSGVARLASGVGGELPVSWASRTVEAGGRTSPEELIAAAHTACYCMALSHELGKAGSPPDRLDASAVCSFAQHGRGRAIPS